MEPEFDLGPGATDTCCNCSRLPSLTHRPMPTAPETRYVKSGDVHIACQVLRSGPVDLVLVTGWVSNIECFWDDPACAKFLRALASFARLIVFDKRGTGPPRHAVLAPMALAAASRFIGLSPSPRASGCARWRLG